jgi:mono/diheme cytochrome c family protein
MIRLVLACIALAVIGTVVLAGDAEQGKRLAESRCAPCHIVGIEPRLRSELADAPPFVMIGRKFGFDADMMVYALTGPHAKMNFSLSRPEADDVAAYVATLAK